MEKRKQKGRLLLYGCAALVFLVLAVVTGGSGKHETIQEVMRDAVLHSSAKVGLFGLIEVNPGLISAFAVTGILILLALALRVFLLPRFQKIPGRAQMLLEQTVGLFDRLAQTSSPHRNRFLGDRKSVV